jgi:hypothetical protein
MCTKNSHKCGNAMETTARLTPATDQDVVDKTFDYRGAIGMLLSLATSTQPNLAFPLGRLDPFVSKPTAQHVGTFK